MAPPVERTRVPASTEARLIEGNRPVRIVALYPANPLTYGPRGGWSYTAEDDDPIDIIELDDMARELGQVRTVHMRDVDSLR